MIYRIQDKDGRGPYKPNFSHVWSEMRCLITAPKQLPFMDEFPDVMEKIYSRYDEHGGHFGCGFSALSQLNNWFKESEIKKLMMHGYAIVSLEPDEVLASSENQIVFWCKKPLSRVANIMESSQ